MAREKRKRIDAFELRQQAEKEARFTNWRAKIMEMYASDTPLRNKLEGGVSRAAGSTVMSMALDSLKDQYYRLNVADTRRHSRDLYALSPIYANKINSLTDMFLWYYTYTPVAVKGGGKLTAEVIDAMGRAVDGLSIETSFPAILRSMFTDGMAATTMFRTASSNTLTTLILPADYCIIVSQTQYGSYTINFDFTYFDGLQLNTPEKKANAFAQFPKEFEQKYDLYLKDRQKMRYQELDPATSTAFAVNSRGNPMFFSGVFPQRQYEQYLENELDSSSQQLEKLIAHKIPTYEDQVVLEVEEMKELHKTMSRAISNDKAKLVTSPGELTVLPIGNDRTKENKTLTNAFATIFNNMGDNSYLYNSEQKYALETTLRRNESFTWGFIQQLITFYNVAVNRAFGNTFKGFQCAIKMMPVTHYNQEYLVDLYKESATLGVGKLEYMAALGIKQSTLNSKIELEELLGLNALKPLMTSYTQKDNEVQEAIKPAQEVTKPVEEDDDGDDNDRNRSTDE